MQSATRRFDLRVALHTSTSRAHNISSSLSNMSAYSTQNDVKANLEQRREEFKERVDARLEEDAAKDPNP